MYNMRELSLAERVFAKVYAQIYRDCNVSTILRDLPDLYL